MRTSRRLPAVLIATALLAGLVVTNAAISTAGAGTAAATAAPAVTVPRTVLFDEGFQNTSNGGGLPIAQYVGTAGDTFTANPYYLDYTQCNGIDLYGTETLGGSICSKYANPRQLRINAENSMRGFATALGGSQFNGLGSGNRAVAFLTANLQIPAGLVELETANPATVPGLTNKYLGFSINSSQVCSDGLSNFVQPSFQLFSKTSAGLTAQSGGFNPCAAYWDRGTLNGSTAILSTSDQVGFRVVNTRGGGLTGNDMGLDDFTVYDETPVISNNFNVAAAPVFTPATLTFTITNTSELQAKNGWSFTDTLPAGLTVADEPVFNVVKPNAVNASSTCPSGLLTATPGGSTVAMQGNLSAGVASCTFSVDVTSAAAAIYTNGPANVSHLVGLKPPANTAIQFTQGPIYY